MTTTADAIVIGAGIHGCSSALHLARAGLKPLVLEQSYPGRHASGVNAGGVRRLGRHLSEIPLSVAAMKRWHSIRELVDDDCGFQRSGQIKVAENERELQKLRDRVAQLQSLGFHHEEIIGQSELRENLPALAGHCVGGIICRDDGFALPYRTVTAFRKAAELAGAMFVSETCVNKLVRQGEHWLIDAGELQVETPVLVNCAGAWAGKLAAQLGETVPVQIEAPMLMITERVAPFCDPVVGATGRPLSFKQFENGTVLIGGGHRGTAYPDKQTSRLDFTGLAISARTALEIFPCLEGVRVQRCWAGIEAVMPDEIPVISVSSIFPDTFHVFGFSAHGFQLGPISGQIIADLLMHGETPLPIDAFSINRFKAPNFATL